MKIFCCFLLLIHAQIHAQSPIYEQNIISLYNLGVEAYEAGELEQAAELMNKATLSDSTCYEAWYMSALIAFETNELISASSNIQKALNYSPFDAEAWSLSGKIKFQLEEIDSAEEALKKAISLGDRRQSNYYFLALCLLETNKFEEALVYFDDLIRIEPQNGNYWLNRGIIYASLSDYERALSDFNQANNLMPNNIPTFIQLANAYLNSNNRELALNFVNAGLAIAILDDRIHLLMLKGEIMRKEGNFDLAEKSLDQAYELDAHNALILVYQAALYLDLEKYELAVLKCNEAIEIDPNFAEAYFNRGIANEMLRNLEAACDDWQEAFLLGSQRAIEYLNSSICNE